MGESGHCEEAILSLRALSFRTELSLRLQLLGPRLFFLSSRCHRAGPSLGRLSSELSVKERFLAEQRALRLQTLGPALPRTPSTPPFLPGLPAQGPPSWCSPISSLFCSFPPAFLGPAAVPCVAKPVLSSEHPHLSALVPGEAGTACGQQQFLLLLLSSPSEGPASPEQRQPWSWRHPGRHSCDHGEEVVQAPCLSRDPCALTS